MIVRTEQMTKANEKTMVAPDVELSKSEIEGAKKDGALEAIKEGGKAAVLADTGTTGDIEAAAAAQNLRVAPDLNTTFLAPLLQLPLDTLVKRLTNDKVEGFIGFEEAKGLLALERAGQNRTAYVQALCKRLGVDDPREVTHAGPPHTNDVTELNHL
jgi:hypothetical protein